MRPLWILLSLMAFPACVEDLSPDVDSDDPGVDTDTDTDEDTEAPALIALTGPEADGSFTAKVKATSNDLWVHLDMETPEWTDEGGDWSIAFKRYQIALNGGVSGDAGVEAVFEPGLAYEAATEAPVEGWITDVEDADDDGDPELAFDTWYDYDASTHVLTPKPGTWFVRGLGDTYAFEVLSYYSEAGDSGYPSVRFKPVTDPGP